MFTKSAIVVLNIEKTVSPSEKPLNDLVARNLKLHALVTKHLAPTWVPSASQILFLWRISSNTFRYIIWKYFIFNIAFEKKKIYFTVFFRDCAVGAKYYKVHCWGTLEVHSRGKVDEIVFAITKLSSFNEVIYELNRVNYHSLVGTPYFTITLIFLKEYLKIDWLFFLAISIV